DRRSRFPCAALHGCYKGFTKKPKWRKKLRSWPEKPAESGGELSQNPAKAPRTTHEGTVAEHDFEPRHLETLDRDLGRFSALERATGYIARPLVAPGIALLFILLSCLAAALI